jgi:nicotinamidase/pyrazinamidase
MKYAQWSVAFVQMWCTPGAESRGVEGTRSRVADAGPLRNPRKERCLLETRLGIRYRDRSFTVGSVGGTILWDVDTQVDFIEPGGKLYFAGAEEARPATARLVEAARVAGVVHVASCDQHELSDPEISEEPDYDSTWPPHCLLGTRGAEKISETKQHDPLPLPLVPVPAPTLRRLLAGGREILIPKKQYDPFTNPNTETLLDVLDPEEIFLFGVATDICDDAAVSALLRRGRRVAFVEGASRGVDESRVAACTAAWREAGVRFTTAEAAAASLG